MFGFVVLGSVQIESRMEWVLRAVSRGDSSQTARTAKGRARKLHSQRQFVVVVGPPHWALGVPSARGGVHRLSQALEFAQTVGQVGRETGGIAQRRIEVQDTTGQCQLLMVPVIPVILYLVCREDKDLTVLGRHDCVNAVI